MVSREEWCFDFQVSAPKPIPRQLADELLCAEAIGWAETRRLGIGGGYRPSSPEVGGEATAPCLSQVSVALADSLADAQPVILPPDTLQAVGFAPEEALFPWPARSFSGNPPAYDPHYHFDLAVTAGFNAYAAPLGFIEAGARDFAGDIPLILKLNDSDSLRTSGEPYSALTASVMVEPISRPVEMVRSAFPVATFTICKTVSLPLDSSVATTRDLPSVLNVN